MAGINKAILIGNLGKDPEIRYTPNGLAVATFSLATTERVKDEDRTEWHNIVAFGRLAEICGEYLAKGRQIYVEGRIQTSSYDDRDGIKRYRTEIIVNTMQMLGQRAGAGSPQRDRPSPPPRPQGQPQQREPQGGRDNSEPSGGYSGGYDPPPNDDDIPF